jgi:hypothetical protein
MDIPNAFIGRKTKPTSDKITAALGPAAGVWNEIITWLAEKHGVAIQEWKPVAPQKYGWSLRLKLKQRTIIYLGPCANCFKVSFVLGDRAVAAARTSNLPKSVLKLLEEAPRYAEGTGLRLLVKSAKDLPAIRTLAEIKLAN